MTLVGRGVPWDVAWTADEAFALAAFIVLSETDPMVSQSFDWDEMRWRDRR